MTKQNLFTEEELAKVTDEAERKHLIECAQDQSKIDMKYMEIMSKTDQWATPDDFFKELDQEFHFNLDPCADEQNHKCEKYFTKEDNGLSKDWGGIACFAILRMVEQLQTGLKRHTEKERKTTRLLLC